MLQPRVWLRCSLVLGCIACGGRLPDGIDQLPDAAPIDAASFADRAAPADGDPQSVCSLGPFEGHGGGLTETSSGMAWSAMWDSVALDGKWAWTSPLAEGERTWLIHSASHGFHVPDTATIVGIEVRVTRKGAGTGPVTDLTVRLRQGGNTVGENRASATTWSQQGEEAVYGGPTDLWGAPWTPGKVSDSEFGAGVAAHSPPTWSGGAASVDSIRIRVYFTCGG